MELIIVDGVLTGLTYFLKNKNQKTCNHCKHCNTKNFKAISYVGRCELNNLKKFSDEWCKKFLSK